MMERRGCNGAMWKHWVPVILQSFEVPFYPTRSDLPFSSAKMYSESFTINSCKIHYSYVTMGAMASQVTSVSILYSTFCSDADQRKHQSSTSLAVVSPVTGEFPTQRTRNAENVSIRWRHHVSKKPRPHLQSRNDEYSVPRLRTSI